MRKGKIPFWFGIVAGVVVTSLLLLYPLDYYIMKPGSAYDVADYVQVEDGDQDDEGTFNFTTVSMAKASPLTYVYAQFKDYYELLAVNEVRGKDEDEEEYNVRQTKLMTDSQFNALYTAFSQAGLTYNVENNGMFVLNVLEGSAADGILQAGDEIVEIDQRIIDSELALGEQIDQKQLGDELELVVKRNEELLTKQVTLKEIPDTDGRVGLGITFIENKTIQTDPHVAFEAEGIGGPSAGLMFTLALLNQLLDEDITKGYDIAGTGEMLVGGEVGRIGGVEKKVVAADAAGMDVFFVPNDEVTEEMRNYAPHYVSNYEAAVKAAETIGTTMDIVPVKTVQDALDYLEQLPDKR